MGFLPSFTCAGLLYGCTNWTITKNVKWEQHQNATFIFCLSNPGSKIPQNSSCPIP